MKTLCSLALAILLSLASTGATVAYAPTPKDLLGNPGDQGSEAIVPQVPGATALVAVVTAIDRQHGTVSFDTELGQIVTYADPEALQRLHPGDQIVLYVVYEDPSQNQARDSIRV
jgi:hypothetical protein